MEVRYFRWFGAIVCCAGILLMLLASSGAAGAAKDPFSAMRVRRIASPVPAGTGEAIRRTLIAENGSFAAPAAPDDASNINRMPAQQTIAPNQRKYRTSIATPSHSRLAVGASSAP